jgi:hypothetical protein
MFNLTIINNLTDYYKNYNEMYMIIYKYLLIKLIIMFNLTIKKYYIIIKNTIN